MNRGNDNTQVLLITIPFDPFLDAEKSKSVVAIIEGLVSRFAERDISIKPIVLAPTRDPKKRLATLRELRHLQHSTLDQPYQHFDDDHAEAFRFPHAGNAAITALYYGKPLGAIGMFANLVVKSVIDLVQPAIVVSLDALHNDIGKTIGGRSIFRDQTALIVLSSIVLPTRADQKHDRTFCATGLCVRTSPR